MNLFAFCVSLVVSDLGALREAHPAVIEQFEERMLETETGPIAYRLHIPRLNDEASVQQVPSQRSHGLLVWLHGIGESGHNNLDQLAWLELFDLNAWPADAFVLAVQCPPELGTWYDASHAKTAPDGLDRLERVYQHVMEQHPIDRNRIWLAGISQGASACWEYASRHPQRFAAIVPMSTYNTRTDWGSRLLPPDRSAQCAVWAFQTTGDGTPQIKWCERTITRLRRHGLSARLTVIDVASHDSWTPALTTHHLTRWLATRDRTRPARWSPSNDDFRSFVRSTGWQTKFLAALCIAVGAGTAVRVVRRCRGRRASEASSVRRAYSMSGPNRKSGS